MGVERSVTCCDVEGHPIGVESFAPSAGGRAPTVVLLHGRDGPDGVAGDRGYRDLAVTVAGAGFRVLLPRYFDRTHGLEPPRGELDALGCEVERYGLWLEAIGCVLRADPAVTWPAGLLGYSLGGYLALTVAMTRPGFAAVAVCYAGVPAAFAGLAGNLPPVLILHGSEDRVVPVSEAAALAKLAGRNRVPHEVHIYPGAGHGFQGPDGENAVRRVTEFLRRHLGHANAAEPSGTPDRGGKK